MVQKLRDNQGVYNGSYRLPHHVFGFLMESFFTLATVQDGAMAVDGDMVVQEATVGNGRASRMRGGKRIRISLGKVETASERNQNFPPGNIKSRAIS
jgi:hypothetical protein